MFKFEFNVEKLFRISVVIVEENNDVPFSLKQINPRL